MQPLSQIPTKPSAPIAPLGLQVTKGSRLRLLPKIKKNASLLKSKLNVHSELTNITLYLIGCAQDSTNIEGPLCSLNIYKQKIFSQIQGGWDPVPPKLCPCPEMISNCRILTMQV